MAGYNPLNLSTFLKLILNEPELFVEFLRDFVPVEILKDIAPSDIEDMTDRLLPILTEQKDLDTVKRINLKDYSFEDLANFGDVISLFMMVDKLKTAETFSEMGKLREEYGDKLNSLNVPPHLKELLVRIIILLLSKIDISQDEIEEFVEKIDERGMSEMLLIENYSVRETRRQAREEARAEVMAETARQIAEIERQRAETAQNLEKAKYVLKSTINLFLNQGYTISEVASALNITEQAIVEILPEFAIKTSEY